MSDLTLPPGWSAEPVDSIPGQSADVPPGWTATPVESIPQPKGDAPSFGQSVMRGIADPAYGLAQLGAKAGMTGVGPDFDFSLVNEPPASPKEVLDTVNQKERDYQERRGPNAGADVGRFIGNIASPFNYLVPGGAPESTLGRVGQAALQSATQSAVMPTYGDENDFWKNKAEQVGIGTGVGAGVGAVGAKLFPRAGADAQTLMDKGVTLTPGQMVSGLKRPEEAMKSIPITGSMIRNAESRSLDSFNRATIGQALPPGTSLPDDIGIGHQAMAFGNQAFRDAYDDLLPKVTLQMTPQITSDLQAAATLARRLPASQIGQFQTTIGDLLRRFDPNTQSMDGTLFKQVESELGQEVKDAYGSNSPKLGRIYKDVLDSLRDNLAVTNGPDLAKQWSDLNRQYAAWSIVSQASTRRPTSGGVFSSGDLLQEIKQSSGGKKSKTFQEGRSLLQPWADTANRVLPNRLPDSGTTERGLWSAELAGLGAALFGEHAPGVAGDVLPWLGAAAVGTMGLGVPYTRAGSAMTGWIPPAARGVLGHGAAPAAAGIVGRAPMQYTVAPSQSRGGGVTGLR